MFYRGWFYVVYMFFFVGLIYLIEQLLGNLYARYVLAYTGTIFFVGMLLGQRSERAWSTHEDREANTMPEAGIRIQEGKES
jgi:hypothetical protein